MRLAIATIVAPLAAPAVLILLTTGGSWPVGDSGLGMYVGFGAAYGYLGLFLGGIPIVVGLRRLRRLNLAALTISGAIAGVLVFQFSLFVLGVMLESSGEYGLLSVAHGALAGASVAFCFGVIAGLENLRGDTNTT